MREMKTNDRLAMSPNNLEIDNTSRWCIAEKKNYWLYCLHTQGHLKNKNARPMHKPHNYQSFKKTIFLICNFLKE